MADCRSQQNDNKRGKFITLEGPDGSGKTTQTEKLVALLTSYGLEVVRTREPGGVSIAEKLRAILLDPVNIISARTELMLYAAARAQHTSELIMPSLLAGKWVVCERYTHASLAYQGYGRNLDKDLIGRLNDIATDGLRPDLTFLLDIDVEKGLERVRGSSRELDRMETETIEFHKRVRAGYLKIADMDERVFLIDSSGVSENTHRQIKEVIEKRMPAGKSYKQ